jgi:hypothetical protein
MATENGQHYSPERALHQIYYTELRSFLFRTFLQVNHFFNIPTKRT